MNSIVFTHVVEHDYTTSHDSALHRLSDWIDAELLRLARLLALMGCGDAAADVAALQGLHLAPDADADDVKRLLGEAAAILERLLERVQGFPHGGETVGPAPADFDAWVRWSGARLEDILGTLRRALAA